MAPRNSGALVVGYAKGDSRRFEVRHASGLVTLEDTPWERSIVGGSCLSCGRDVYMNHLGYSAVLENDADVVCQDCEDRYAADITRSL